MSNDCANCNAGKDVCINTEPEWSLALKRGLGCWETSSLMNHAKSVQQCSYFSELPLHKAAHSFLIPKKMQPSTKTFTREATTAVRRGLERSNLLHRELGETNYSRRQAENIAKPNWNNSSSKTQWLIMNEGGILLEN